MKFILHDSGGNLSGPGVYNGMTMTGMLILNKYPTDDSEAVNKEYVDSVSTSLNAERVLSGIMRLDLFPDMIGDLTSVSGSGLIELRHSGVQPGLFPKVTVNRGGIVTSGGSLNAGDIPGFSWSKISVASRPNTATGYGITDAVNRVSGTVTGNVRVTYIPEQPEDLVNVSYVEESISTIEAYSVGDIVAFDSAVTPEGFLRCNGGSLLKSMYPELYDLVGERFKPGYYIVGSGKPWKQQYEFNSSQSGDITGWSDNISSPEGVSNSQAIVTKNRVYMLGGRNGSSFSAAVYTAPIYEDGTLGAWTTDTPLPEGVADSQAIVTKNRVYLLGGSSGGGGAAVYTAPIYEDGTLGAWSTGNSLPTGLNRSQAIVTKSRVYLLGGSSGGGGAAVYTAPIDEDGILGTWSTGNSLPTVVYDSQAIVTKSRVYLLGGVSGSGVGNYTAVYTAPINEDGTLGAWSTGTSLPRNSHGSQAIVTKNRVYLIGGGAYSGDDFTAVNTAPINEDGILGAWSTGPRLPVRVYNSRAIVTKGRVYLLGVYTGTSGYTTLTASISENGILGAWGKGVPLPVQLNYSQAIVTKNRVYLLGGRNGSSFSAAVYTAPIYEDDTLGAWSADTPLPTRVYGSQAIVTKNRVYLIGGLSGATNYSSTVYTAPINEDGTLGAWSADTPLPGQLGYSQAIITKNRVYMLGGQRRSGTTNIITLSTVYTAPINEDGTLGTWTTGSSLPATLSNSQAIVTKNRVYMLGGLRDSSILRTVYTAPINEDGTLGTWSTGNSLPTVVYDSQAIVTKSRVYLLGGVSGSGAVSSTVYTAPINEDGTLGRWGGFATGSSLPVTLSNSQAIVTKNLVYMLGGYTSSGGGNYTPVIYSAPFSGGDNDYSQYYYREYDSGSNNLNFNIPDYISEEGVDTINYIKY